MVKNWSIFKLWEYLVSSIEVRRMSEPASIVLGSTVHQAKTGNSEPTAASPSTWARSFGLADWALAFFTFNQNKLGILKVRFMQISKLDTMHFKSTSLNTLIVLWAPQRAGANQSNVNDRNGPWFLTIFTVIKDLSIVGWCACRNGNSYKRPIFRIDLMKRTMRAWEHASIVSNVTNANFLDIPFKL